MKLRIVGLLCGGLLSMAAPAGAQNAPLKVRFRAEGARSTLVSQRTVTLADAPIVRDGDPTHSCPGQSALGALQAGTQGDWTGSWSEGLGYFVSEIAGEKPAGSDFFSLWVDHKQTTTGLCQTDLAAGDDVLLFVDRCVFDAATQGCKNKPVTPLGISVPRTARRGSLLTVKVVSYTLTGRAKPVAGAAVYANGRLLNRRTTRRGILRLRATRVGAVSFFATHAGNAKSEVDKIRIRKA